MISNQSGVGRGFYSHLDVKKLHTWINKKLIPHEAFIDRFYFSPYFKFSTNKNIDREKSLENQIRACLKAMEDFKIDKDNSYFIGDNDSDRKAAKILK